MGTMYDRLGDLLSETLTTGFVEKKNEKPISTTVKDSEEKSKKEKQGAAQGREQEKKEDFSRKVKDKKEEKQFSEKKTKSLVLISPKVLRACHLLDITVSASLDDVRKAYKEKIKYYHPDKYEKNPVLRNVANKKTRMIVEAYNLLLKSFV